MAEESKSYFTSIFDGLKQLGSLYVENVKLTAAEKVTALISAVALAIVALVLGLAMFVFLMMGIASLLESYIAPFWSYLIISGIFALIIAIMFIFRVKLVYNPVARFISRLFIEPPTNEEK